MFLHRVLLQVQFIDPDELLINLKTTGKTKIPGLGEETLFISENGYSPCLLVYENFVTDGFSDRKTIFRSIMAETRTWIRLTGEVQMTGSDVGEIPEVKELELRPGRRHKPHLTYFVSPLVVEFLSPQQFDRLVKEE